MTKMSSLFSGLEFLAQTAVPDGAPAAAPGAAPQPGAGSMLTGIMPMVLLFAAMYFLMIAPQRKKQKAHEALLKSLESGDQIVTTGGIYGTITNVKEDRFVVRISDDNTKIEIGKAFVQQVLNKQAAVPAAKK